MLRKILKWIKQNYSIPSTQIYSVRQLEISNIDSTTIRLVFPHGILGEDVILREENNLNTIEYESNNIYYLDFINVNCIDSIGIGYLTKQVKSILDLKSDYKLINVNDKVRNALKLLGFLEYLNVE